MHFNKNTVLYTFLLSSIAIFSKDSYKKESDGLKSIANQHKDYVEEFICHPLEELGEFIYKGLKDVADKLSPDQEKKLKHIAKEHEINLRKTSKEVDKVVKDHKKKLQEVSKDLSASSSKKIDELSAEHHKNLEDHAKKVTKMATEQQEKLKKFSKSLSPNKAKRIDDLSAQHKKDLEDVSKKMVHTAEQHNKTLKHFSQALTAKKESKSKK